MADSVTKPLSWFKEGKNCRKKPLDETKLRELGESMEKKNGQLQDGLAEPDGTLISGYRRLAAAKLVGIESFTGENHFRPGRGRPSPHSSSHRERAAGKPDGLRALVSGRGAEAALSEMDGEGHR